MNLRLFEYITMASNKSIRDFFQPKAVAEPNASASAASQAFKVPSAPTMRAANVPAPSTQMAPQPSSAPKSSDPRSYTSSLSPPPSSDASDRPHSGQRENAPPAALPAKSSSDRVIQNSDDEDDSDDSLEDLSTILAARFPNSVGRPKMSGDKPTPTTPAAPRYKTRTNFHVSPMPVLSKKKFDLKSLVSHAEDDEAAEATTQRYKAMLEEPDVEDDDRSSSDAAKRGKFKHSGLLESVVANGEDGGAHRVARAIQRTEATVTEQRWYFFETGTKQVKPERKRFPIASVPETFKDVLVDPRKRQQTFVSGFAEDMVSMGHELPDELFLWMLDEVSVEPRDPLRTAYFSTMRQSHEQITRLITDDVIRSIFLRLGANPKAQEVEVLKSVNKLKDPYPRRNWANLLAIIKFFGQVAKLLEEKSRRYIIFTLLKMSLDKMVSENVDIHAAVQETIARMSQYIVNWDDTVCFPILICTPSKEHHILTSPPVRLRLRKHLQKHHLLSSPPPNHRKHRLHLSTQPRPPAPPRNLLLPRLALPRQPVQLPQHLPPRHNVCLTRASLPHQATNRHLTRNRLPRAPGAHLSPRRNPRRRPILRSRS